MDDTGNTPPAVFSVPADKTIRVLKKRAQFLALNRARRQVTAGLLVQGRDRGDDDPTVGVGFTCSKKVGNAVARNRAKRRLREVARAVLPELARPGWDYTLIGRAEVTATRPMGALHEDLSAALGKLHGRT